MILNVWADSSCVSLVSGNLPTNCPRQFEPLLTMARMLQASRVGRVNWPDNSLLSSDSGTHYKPIPLPKRELVRKYLAFQICRGSFPRFPGYYTCATCPKLDRHAPSRRDRCPILNSYFFAAMLSASRSATFRAIFSPSRLRIRASVSRMACSSSSSSTT
jgi:hypothetical protein